MKKMILVFTAALFLAGCSVSMEKKGKDGLDGLPGKIYISFWHASGNTPSYFAISDNNLPLTINTNVYYLTQPGYYSMSYTNSIDNSYYQTNYTLTNNPGTAGEPGSIGRDGTNGVNGDDIYYEVDLNSSGSTYPGPNIYVYSTPDYSYTFYNSIISKGMTVSDASQKETVRVLH